VVSDNSQVMLVRYGGNTIGLLVDDLHSVQQFDSADMTESPLGVGEAALAPRLIKANQGNLLIQEIDLERLFARCGRSRCATQARIFAVRRKPHGAGKIQ
jgi:chemotaxis signal transduction protein